MNYHNITPCDMLNGEGLRVVLWLSGCELQCKNCQNPQTWDPLSGIPFDDDAKEELFRYLSDPHIHGITFSGGHPLHEYNVIGVNDLIDEIRVKFPNKTIWLYTGNTLEEIMVNARYHPNIINLMKRSIISKVDVLCDGRFVEELKDTKTHWVGSTNQRVIDIPRTIKKYKEVYGPPDESIPEYEYKQQITDSIMIKYYGMPYGIEVEEK